MANSLYAKGRNSFLKGEIASLSDTIKVGLWSTSYTPNLTTDQFFNPAVSTSFSVGGAVIAASVALTTKTASAGTLSADNTLFSAVSGSAAAYVGLYKDTGTTTTSNLIGLIDTATGLPVTPNGGDITVAWSSGAIFTLFEGLTEKEKWSFGKMIRDFLESLGIPARLGPGGIWIPEPKIIVTPRLVAA